MCQKSSSAKAQEFRSNNAVIPSMVDEVNCHLVGRGVWDDRCGASRKLLEPLLDKHLPFVIRSTGERTVRTEVEIFIWPENKDARKMSLTSMRSQSKKLLVLPLIVLWTDFFIRFISKVWLAILLLDHLPKIRAEPKELYPQDPESQR